MSATESLIERLRKPHRQIHRSTKAVVLKSPPAIQIEAADKLKAQDAELEALRSRCERMEKAPDLIIERCRTMIRERSDSEARGQGVITGLLYAIQFIEESKADGAVDGGGR